MQIMSPATSSCFLFINSLGRWCVILLPVDVEFIKSSPTLLTLTDTADTYDTVDTDTGWCKT